MLKRAVIFEPNKIVVKEYSLDREPKNGESLLKILYCGICGSDVHVFKGKHPFVEFPVSTGHEVIGVVEKSDLFKKGQYLAIRPSVWDNECYYCKHGMPHIYEPLKVRGFQEAGKKVAVVGLGTIGILTAAVSKVYGAKEVIGFDVNSWKVQKAKEFNFVSNALSPQENNSYMDFDVVFEAVGIQSSIDTAFNLVRKRGTIIIIGVFAGPGTVPLHLIQDREYIIMGALMYTDDDFSESVNLISQKRINTQALISKIFDGTDHVPDAFQFASSETNSFKTLIKL
ncbi:zinc-dependent alcohol dehydrogenase [Petrotoga olearia]|uniref:Alcohol dehydrogenase n=2 Tax=Petrotoga olearia TaxID=156203 RepID=A0A2K1P066_9BACT|nr:zinc-binding dehydrogenase [Petrotoga olearia]PNR96185.1 hypothetical protein X929_06375 [Petrotoga olearia DSM 13574]RMA71543.1 L-iditol 2-dehydrogenase [Petrotoga olearia]